jgi:hypothetical protein
MRKHVPAVRARMMGMSPKLHPGAEHAGLDDGEDEGEPASVLGELLAAGLALLGELGDAGDGDAEELEDDGGVDVGHDAEGKDGELAEGAAGEGVQEVEQSA